MKLTLNKKALVTAGIAAVLSATNFSATAEVSENTTKGGGQMSENTTALNNRQIAESAIFSAVASGDCDKFSKLMNDKAKDDWNRLNKQLVWNGKNYFAPDFCRVTYPFVGSSDQNGFILGLYNPFYDAFMIVKASKGEKAKLTGICLVTTDSLSGRSFAGEFPATAGTRVSADYFSEFQKQMTAANKAFHDKFSNPQFSSSFSVLEQLNKNDEARLNKIMKFRLGSVVRMSEDKELKAHVILATAVIGDERLSARKVVATDGSTKKILTTLSGNAKAVRKNFQVVGCFLDGDVHNVIFVNSKMPSFLIQAVVGKDNVVHLRMFNAMMDAGVAQK